MLNDIHTFSNFEILQFYLILLILSILTEGLKYEPLVDTRQNWIGRKSNAEFNDKK
jgi:hypothetical protein